MDRIFANVRWILLLLIFLIFAYWAYSLRYFLASIVLEIRYDQLILSLAMLLLVYILECFLFRNLLKALGAELGFKEVYCAYFISNFAKYIPGRIWQVASNTYLLRRCDVSIRLTLFVTAVLSIISVLTGTIFAIPVIQTCPDAYLKKIMICCVVGAAFLLISLACHNRTITRLLEMILAKFGISKGYNFKAVQVAPYILGFFIVWILLGASFVLLAQSIPSTHQIDYLLFTSVYAFSYVAGMIVFLVPSGLGIRESIMVMALSYHYPIEIASTFAVLSRFLMIVAETLLGVCAIIVQLMTVKDER